MSNEPVLEEPRTDFYLRLLNKDALPTALSCFYKQDVEMVTDEETGEETLVNVGDPYLVKHTPDYAIDLVGIFTVPTGVTLTDTNGNDYPETTELEGWHVNIRLNGHAILAAVELIDADYGLRPNNPRRTWA